MSALVETYDAQDAAEAHRRRMLADTDALLERLEELRLADRTLCPPDLAADVRSLQLRMGRVTADRARTVRAAHHAVFAIQARLMAANPRHPRPRALPGRPAGVPRLTVLRQGGAWKFLALPPLPAGAEPAAVAEWRLLVQLTVARALDRWSCAQDQAVHAARVRASPGSALHRAGAAWRNYWDLRCEAEILLTRTALPPQRMTFARPRAVAAATAAADCAWTSRGGRAPPRPRAPRAGDAPAHGGPPARRPRHRIEPMQPVVIGDVLWEPTPDVVQRSRLRRFMNAHGIADVPELLRRSTEDLEWFWDATARDLGIRFERPYDRVVDLGDGIEWARWWPGARMNIVATCLDQWLDGPTADRTAVVWEGEPGEVRRLTYRELHEEVCRLARALRRLGVTSGDRVAVFMPLVPETAVALLACARLGAVFLPLFSGYGAAAIASRLNDSGARVLLCADGFYRRGQVIPMKETADQALAQAPGVERVVVLRRVGREVPWTAGRDLDWSELVQAEAPEIDMELVDPEAQLMIIYTSGTTGRPKGAIHVHGGFPVKTAQDMAHGFDVQAGDVVFWFTDIGWMMGPWLIFGSLVLGATMVLYEGTPDTPAPDRLWRMVADHRVTILGVSPTLVRGLMSAGPEHPRRHDLSSLRVLGGTGEPWNPEPFHWYFREVGGARAPVINYTGGTEIAGGILCGNVLSRLRPCSFAGPLPGMAADVVDEHGRSVRGEVGELVVRQPWPGMTRGFWGDRDRYLATYWSRFPGTWVHGDWAYVADDGLWYVLGRSDDTIKVAGKRLGPAEVESVLVANPAVAESAAIGVPDELKGEALVCFVVLRPGHEPEAGLAERLRAEVATALGRPLRPKAVHFVEDLPRTRNAKILRRVVRSVYLGQEPGDLTALENPAALEAIGATRG
jgi:acetyl-CoA synthetase